MNTKGSSFLLPRCRKIDLYILKESIVPFFFGFFVFTFVLLMDNIFKLIDYIVGKKVEPVYILQIIIYVLPFIFSMTIPMAVLVSMISSFGRLSSDSEIIAVKSFGVNPLRILFLPIITSVIIFLSMSLFSNFVVPEANYRMKKTLMIITRKNPSLNLREHIFNKIYENYTIWAEKIDQSKGRLENVQFIERIRGKEKRIIISGECIMKVMNDTLFLNFKDGEIHEIDETVLSKYRILNFKNYLFRIPLPEESSIKKIYRGKREMTLFQILDEMKKIKDKNTRWRYLIEINKNFAIPLASILFVLVGSGIGMGARVGGLSIGVTASFFIFIIYYILLVFGEELAERNILHPGIGIWIPNLFLLIVSIYIYHREIYGK